MIHFPTQIPKHPTAISELIPVKIAVNAWVVRFSTSLKLNNNVIVERSIFVSMQACLKI